MSQELKPCPFCGKGNTAKLVPASDFLADEDDDYGYTHRETFAVVCDASAPGGPGGCGGSGGFKPTEDQAIAAWNTRTQQPEQVVPEVPVAEAVKEAVSAIYFADSSDYETALWFVVKALAPDLADLLETNGSAAYHQADSRLLAASGAKGE